MIAEVTVSGTEERTLPVTLMIEPDGGTGLRDAIPRPTAQSQDRIEWRCIQRVSQSKSRVSRGVKVGMKFPEVQGIHRRSIAAVRIL